MRPAWPGAHDLLVSPPTNKEITMNTITTPVSFEGAIR
jgi:hypothetical protein